MKKIGYVLSSFPILSETFISTEIRAMQRRGHQVQPFSFRHYGGEYQQRDESLKEQTIYLSDHSRKIALKALPLIKPGVFKALSFALKQRGLPTKSLLGNALKLVYLAHQAQCTHLHAHFAQATAATAIVAARLYGITVSFVGHGYDVYATPQDLTLKLNTVDFAVAVCRDLELYFQQLAPKANTGLVYCGVETDRFSQPATAPAQRTAEKLLFIGRLCETKGLFTLLNALKMIESALRPSVDFVGDGVLREDLIAYAKEHQLTDQVNFLGSKQSTWLINNSHHYAAMVVPFEMAPNGDRDTGPVVVKEAMALKLPVLSTYFMGVKEMLTEETGMRVQPKDTAALAKMITQFCQMSAEDVDTMAQNAYERVKTHYNADVQAVGLSDLVESV